MKSLECRLLYIDLFLFGKYLIIQSADFFGQICDHPLFFVDYRLHVFALLLGFIFVGVGYFVNEHLPFARVAFLQKLLVHPHYTNDDTLVLFCRFADIFDYVVETMSVHKDCLM